MASKTDLPDQNRTLSNFVHAYLVPTLVGMALILFCGANYSRFPGRGFGIGLMLSVIFTLGVLGLFLWRYRDYEEV